MRALREVLVVEKAWPKEAMRVPACRKRDRPPRAPGPGPDQARVSGAGTALTPWASAAAVSAACARLKAGRSFRLSR
jgi:hypothetical protein